jgi:hypothetical protein
MMSKHIGISPDEFADGLAIRELVEAYAHCADRRDARNQMSLHMAVLRSACSLSTGWRSAHYHNR